MVHEIQLKLRPEQAANEMTVKSIAASVLGIDQNTINSVKQLRRSIDARGRQVKINLNIRVYEAESMPEERQPSAEYPNVADKDPVIVVGSGPGGMFAALRLIELGYKPIVLERGNDVQKRRRDLKAINRDHEVNADSNYCFGEGGAGTYSDGKLYTRSKKRGSVDRILNILVDHGAVEDILVDTHPHIGTNKLPKIVARIRETILEAGGEYHFNQRVDDFIIKENRITGVVTSKGDKIDGKSVILATGHSARDIYRLLHKKNILLEAKSFAMGVRIEHSQSLIDSIQYHCGPDRGPYLPAASYKLVQQVDKRGVYSFCMCPGGFIVPSATGPEQVVVNGMSPSKRDNKFANSGMVVGIETEDLAPYKKHGVLAGLYFQEELEKTAWIAGGSTQAAPAQRVVDFCEGKLSNNLNDSSYIPGLTSAPLDEVLGSHIAPRLKGGLKAFGKKMKGYYTNEANLIGVESRTSSPVRIPRDRATLEHPQIKGLFPCGEGAGFAGGIVSAAIDGERCAEAVVNLLQ